MAENWFGFKAIHYPMNSSCLTIDECSYLELIINNGFVIKVSLPSSCLIPVFSCSSIFRRMTQHDVSPPDHILALLLPNLQNHEWNTFLPVITYWVCILLQPHCTYQDELFFLFSLLEFEKPQPQDESGSLPLLLTKYCLEYSHFCSLSIVHSSFHTTMA